MSPDAAGRTRQTNRVALGTVEHVFDRERESAPALPFGGEPFLADGRQHVGPVLLSFRADRRGRGGEESQSSRPRALVIGGEILARLPQRAAETPRATT